MTFLVRATGLAQAAADLQVAAAALLPVAEAAVNATTLSVSGRAAQLTAQRYNLSEDTLRDYIFVRRASVTADKVSGTVQLQIKAVPLTAFGAQVQLVSRTLRAAFGRPTKPYTRLLPQVSVQLYRGQAAKKLPGGFPLRQRDASALLGGEKVRRRIGPERDRLTGFRYYTFPRRITDKLLPQL